MNEKAGYLLIKRRDQEGFVKELQKKIDAKIHVPKGGLTSTLIFAPIIIPPLYLWMEKNKKIKPQETNEIV